MSDLATEILPGTGRGTVRRKANGGGGGSLRKPEVYRARKLRRNLSLPEAILWKRLSSSKLGFSVRKQHPIGPYIADFYVARAQLVIEVDGEGHNRGDRPKRDERRNEYLKDKGYRLLRIPASDVLKDMDAVLCGIAAEAARPLHHAAHGPPPRAGEDL